MTERVSKADLTRIAELVAVIGGRLGAPSRRDDADDRVTVAEAAWVAAAAWEPGPRAANLDPDVGGNRWDTDTSGQVWPVPSDPTGEAAGANDPAALLLPRYQRALGRLEDAACEVRDIVAELLPVQPGMTVKPCGACGAPRPVRVKTRARDMTAADAALAGWCKSCFRDDRYLQPIETDRTGTRYYRDHCRWCGGFESEHRVEPPVELLRIRHRGGKVTTADLQRHLPAAPIGPKRDRSRRGWRRTRVG